MIITDPALADALHEVSVIRCQVRAARHWHEAFTGPCTSPYECCACSMPSKDAKGPCEMCHKDNYRPMQPVSSRGRTE